VEELTSKFEPYGENGDTVDRRIVYEITHRKQKDDDLISDSESQTNSDEEANGRDKDSGISE
jgi:hypothetical protein